MGGVGTVLVVVDAPVSDEDLGFEEAVELPEVEQLVAEPAVERLDPGVLPPGARVDEHARGAFGCAPLSDRTDQMPYGGIRDSGNTKEGPAWAVREMIEERLVVIQR